MPSVRAKRMTVRVLPLYPPATGGKDGPVSGGLNHPAVILGPRFNRRPSPHLAHVQHVVRLREVHSGDDLLRPLPAHAEHRSNLVSAHEAARKQDHEAILHCA